MIQNYPKNSEYLSSNGYEFFHYIISDSPIEVTCSPSAVYGVEDLGDNLYEVHIWGVDMDWGEDTGELYKTWTFTAVNEAGETATFSFKEYDLRSDIVFDNAQYLFTDEGTEYEVYFRTYYLSLITATAYNGAEIVSAPVVVSTTSDGKRWMMKVKLNTGNKGYVTVSGKSTFSGQSLFSIERSVVLKGLKTVVFPCWKDTFYTFRSNADSVDYTIVDNRDGSTIFKGKAYRLGEEISIPLNNIAQSYLYSSFDLESAPRGTWVEDKTASLYFSLKVDGKAAAKFFTWLDFSYDPEEELVGSLILNDPIMLTSPANGYTVFSFINSPLKESLTLSIEGSNSGMLIWDDPVNEGEWGVYHLVVNEDVEPDDYMVDYVGGTQSENAFTLDIHALCNRYELIYKNDRGGYDSFTILGNDKTSNSVTNYTIDRTYRNTTSQFKKSQYLKDITTSVELHTGWLTDKQSSKMGNLLESTKVYLYDMHAERLYPVLMSDTKWEMKTYSNQGKKMVDYTIKIEYSQNKIKK